ncbi:hypothetical protein [uncultured Shimia sp.]|uniref:tetratricopeptide repeat protein n=1 Tax=uncultured Shimia sp. TaxID=573152 RepID=UPI002605A17D|nr:hypothetical protein [uncultured Shimia sp.]
MPDPDAPKGMQYRIAPDVIRVAAARVYGSQTFKAAKQQEMLLRFLVEDYLAGRAQNGSREAVIAEFFADRPEEEVGRKLAWAFTRLSEKLAEYYQRDGADDPVRISVNPAQHDLDFQMWEAKVNAPKRQRPMVPFRLLVPAGLLIAGLVIGIGLILTQEGPSELPISAIPIEGLRAAQGRPPLPAHFAELTVPMLEDEARNHLFPILEMDRQRLAIAIAYEAIDRDPQSAQAYATAGYALSTLAIVTSGGGVSRRHLEDARRMRKHAMALAPQDPWVLSSAALTAFAEKEFSLAMELSKQAYTADSQDPYVSSAFGVVAMITHQYEEALEATRKDRISDVEETVVARERLYAFSSFHLGDFGEAISVLENSEREGRGHNVTTLMYLAASYQANGDHTRAKEAVQRIQTGWPTFRPEMIARVFFRDPEEADFLMQNLSAAGWSFLE